MLIYEEYLFLKGMYKYLKIHCNNNIKEVALKDLMYV